MGKETEVHKEAVGMVIPMPSDHVKEGDATLFSEQPERI